MAEHQIYCFRRTRNGMQEWGVATGETPEAAMARVLGSHPGGYGVTEAHIFLPDDDGQPMQGSEARWPEAPSVPDPAPTMAASLWQAVSRNGWRR